MQPDNGEIAAIRHDLRALEKLAELAEEPYIRCDFLLDDYFARLIIAERDRLTRELKEAQNA